MSTPNPTDQTKPITPTGGCRFYGCHAVPRAQVLVESQGNQCALVRDAYAPCQMEIEGKPVDWQKCPKNYQHGSMPFEHFTKVRL